MTEIPEKIIPDWFPAWFDNLFQKETTTPSYIHRRLGIQKDIIYRALWRGELEAIGPPWVIPKPALKTWFIDNFSLNKP